MTSPNAKVIIDSISPDGHRLTTMEVVIHRFVLSEFNTHRSFSRNSASSRAIPTRKQMARVETETAFPVSWPCERPGMQGGDELDGNLGDAASAVWRNAMQDAVRHATALAEIGVHKSVVNRLLEPFMWHTVIVSSTEWENFFGLRCNSLAQPEIRVAAESMRDVFEASEPSRLEPGEWHLPYIDGEDWSVFESRGDGIEIAKAVSAARCARVSYLTHDGRRDHSKDIELYERLVSADPPHISPLEHVATPTDSDPTTGNFVGWRQLRYELLATRAIPA
jgi:thymidylate synthase ThyX